MYSYRKIHSGPTAAKVPVPVPVAQHDIATAWDTIAI